MGENICVCLVTTICKELLKLKNKKRTQFFKMADLNRYLSKETQMANKHMQRCSLVIKKIQINSTMKYHFRFTSMSNLIN